MNIFCYFLEFVGFSKFSLGCYTQVLNIAYYYFNNKEYLLIIHHEISIIPATE